MNIDVNQIVTSIRLNGGLTYADHQVAVNTYDKLKALGLGVRLQHVTLKDALRTIVYRICL